MLPLLALACSVTIFPRHGVYVATPVLHGPGLLLDGGGALEAPSSSLVWLHHQLLGATRRRGGNVVVLRASDRNIYDEPFYRDENFASVLTVLIPPRASRAQIDSVAPMRDGAGQEAMRRTAEEHVDPVVFGASAEPA